MKQNNTMQFFKTNFITHHRKIAVASLIVVVAIIASALVKSSTESEHPIYISSRSSEQPFNVLKKIEQGIAMLKSSPPLQYETTNGDPNGPLKRRQIAFALFDTKSGDLFERRYWFKESDVENVNRIGIVTLLPDNQKNINSVNMTVKWWNAFNSYFETNDETLIVVADKYLISRQYLPEQKNILLTTDGPKNRYTDMTYAPYSQALHWPNVVDQGVEYLSRNIIDAYEELRENGVKSQSSKGDLIVDVIDPKLLVNIALTEQIDTSALLLAEDGGIQLAERVLIMLGANQEWAYRYTSSSAGASGIAQFIKPTYDAMAEMYPDAKMITNYEVGMAHHTNAMKSMVLFLDHHKAVLEKNIKKDKLANGTIEDAMLAATYNGGPSATIRAVNTKGLTWQESNIYVSETKNYIKKYYMVDALNIFPKIEI